MTELPIFPLGAVLFPHLPLSLRLFEERYLVMLARLLETQQPEFGVVLIERGQEVGGGEHRSTIGTTAVITELAGGAGSVLMNTEGTRRFEVIDWLEDAPYPRANVSMLAPFEWDDDLSELHDRTEAAVRRALAVASEFTEQRWAAVVELADDPVESAWQLAGIAPVTEFDQQVFLAARSLEELLTEVGARAAAVGDMFFAPPLE
jgi:Lon protease-like protein